MTGSAIDRLTDGQKDCLRLVLQLKQTKEIARELGISPDTVKQRIGIAMRNLGAENRVQAARMLEAHENPTYPREVYTPAALVPSTTPGSEQRSTGDGNRNEARGDTGSRETDRPPPRPRLTHLRSPHPGRRAMS